MSSREASPEVTTSKKEDVSKKVDSPDTKDAPSSENTTTTTPSPTNNNNASTDDNERVVNPDDLIDMNTFEQLLDMDDEDDHEFSLSIVNNYFEQAEATFKDMDKALEKKDLTELSRLGHFLKGSSAAIGLKKVKATCEKIQNIGNCQEEDGSKDIDEEEALKRITSLLPQVKTEYSEAEEYLKNFYEVQDAR